MRTEGKTTVHYYVDSMNKELNEIKFDKVSFMS
jgi:hypothetical protein